MQEINLEHMSDSIRVQLSADGKEALWNAVEDCGGVTAIAAETGYSRSKLYNWRHKDTFVPASFVRDVLDDADQYVERVKGGGRSRPFTPVEFPLPVDDELLTRIACSVHVNRDGVPTYQADDAGNVHRFVTLLQDYGDVPIALYHRNVYELRYPKYLHDIFTAVPYEDDFAAHVDEEGHVTDGALVTDDEHVPINTFDGVLYHRGKKLQLALARGDSETITQLMVSEAQNVQQLVR